MTYRELEQVNKSLRECGKNSWFGVFTSYCHYLKALSTGALK